MASSIHPKPEFNFSALEVTVGKGSASQTADNIAQCIIFYRQAFAHVLKDRFSEYYDQRIDRVATEIADLIKDKIFSIVGRHPHIQTDIEDCVDEILGSGDLDSENGKKLLARTFEKMFVLYPELEEEAFTASLYLIKYIDNSLALVAFGAPDSDIDLTISNVRHVAGNKLLPNPLTR